jgi:hypothetical protein
MYMAAARNAVSSALAKGRWKRAMGLRKAVCGQPLVAETSPIRALMPCWAVVRLDVVRSGVVTVTSVSS